VSELKPVKIGVIGLGTVGGGAIHTLQTNADIIQSRVGRPITVVGASARDLNKPRLCDTSNIRLTTDPFDLINDPEIDIILELVGGTTFAKELVLAAISQGKHVVTANKALIAEHGNEIFKKADEAKVTVAFEAAVAGGIPIIKAIKDSLAGNKIEYLAGIINGTGNFILSEMFGKGREFSDVLAEAQELGYAEADPTFDIEGTDAAHKLAILASIAFDMPLAFDHVYTEGISKLTPQDMQYADELGYYIKHLAIAREDESGVELRVHPCLVKHDQLLGNINGVMNAVLVKGDAVGPTLYSGAGAGAGPTGSAVLGDLIDVARNLHDEHDHALPGLGCKVAELEQPKLKSVGDITSAYYLRIMVSDRTGVLAAIANELATNQISIESVIQREHADDELVPLVLVTHETTEKLMQKAVDVIKSMPAVNGDVMLIRIADVE
jgi:homoserine dehydrogenase